MNLATKDEIFSAMVVYGFLSGEDGKVSIPNKERMDTFEEMLVKEPSLGYIYRLARESDRMLKATLAGETQEMERIPAVGMAFDRTNKKHRCKVETLRERTVP